MLSRISTLTAAFARRASLAMRRASDRWAERAWEAELAPYAPVDDGEVSALLRRMGAPGLNEYAAQQRESTRALSFLPADRRAVVARLDREFPGFRRQCLSSADAACDGRFDLLGSGVVDRRRDGATAGLDWRLDPRSGQRFPARFSHWRAARPGLLSSMPGVDIKGPWELGRCQHFAVLGEAYWLTGDERYARAFAAAISDFLDQNPPGCGVQWACTMDVALRIVSWLIGLSFCRGSAALDDGWWKCLLLSVVEHGRFIAGNLEFGTLDGKIVTSNHYLANLLGLQWIAYAFPELDNNAVWRGLAEYGFEREIQDQIYPDGGSFESSLPYQRLVVEICLSAYAISLHAGRPLSNAFRSRLFSALCLIRTVRQPGGRIPQIGDCDNGRAHVLTGFGTWQPERFDHLLAAGAHVLNCPELAADLNVDEAVEAVFWDVADQAGQRWPAADAVTTFDDFGLAVVRRGAVHVVVSNGPSGTKGFGNHKHCDQLAIEICVGSQPVFVDAGSYLYTPEPEERNRFRATAIHNTVMIDGEEQHLLNPTWLFRLNYSGEASRFEVAGAQHDAVCVRARHTAYARLSPPIVHERHVSVDGDASVRIEDRFDRPEGHRFRWQFLLHPSVTAAAAVDAAVRLTWDGGGADFEGPRALPFEIVDAWYSPGYGVRVPTHALVAASSEAAPVVAFTLRPRGSSSR